MKRKLLKILQNCSIKDIAMLSSGVFLSQFIGIIAQPIATRLYSPEDFGILNIILSLLYMCTPLLVLQYDLCIVTASSDEEADTVTALSVYVMLLMTVLFSLGIVIFVHFFPQTFKIARGWIYMVIPFLLFTGVGSIVENYNNRYGQFGLIAKISVYRALISNLIKLGLGSVKVGFPGLMIGTAVSEILGMKRQASYLLENSKRIFSSPISKVKEAAVKNIAQPLFAAPGIFVVGYAYSVIPLYINYLYNTADVGYYGLATSMLGLPMALISSSIGKVFFRNASKEMKEKGNFSRSFNSTLILLLATSVIPFTILYFAAEPLFSIVFGHQWFRSGTFVKYLLPMYAVRFVANALIIGLIICGKQKQKLLLQASFLVVSFITFWVSKLLILPIEQFLFLSSLGYAGAYIIMLIVIYKNSKEQKI